VSKKRYGEALVKDLDLRPGDIILLQIKGWVCRAVWFMQLVNGDASKWTHVAIVLDDDTVFEAQPGGAVITPLAEYADRTARIVRFYQEPGRLAGLAVPYRLRALDDVLTDNRRREIVATARRHVDIGYNWGTYVYLAAYRVGIRPRWLKNRVQNDERLICSQAADLIYDLCNVHLFADQRMPYDVTPGDLATLS
jgi:hypothetical protein